MSVAIAIRKAMGRISVCNLQGMVVVKTVVTLKDVDMLHISITHSLFLGNHNDAVDVGKEFLLMPYMIYL